MHRPLYPSLYQINTCVWLTERSRALGRRATLDDMPDAELDRAAGMGFDWIWLLSGRSRTLTSSRSYVASEILRSGTPIQRWHTRKPGTRGRSGRCS